MKMALACIFALMGAFSVAHADEEVVCGAPADETLCTLNVGIDASRCDFYELRTTYQLVSHVNVDTDSDCTKSIDADRAKAVYTKLLAEANSLKIQGVCKAVIDNTTF